MRVFSGPTDFSMVSGVCLEMRRTYHPIGQEGASVTETTQPPNPGWEPTTSSQSAVINDQQSSEPTNAEGLSRESTGGLPTNSLEAESDTSHASGTEHNPSQVPQGNERMPADLSTCRLDNDLQATLFSFRQLDAALPIIQHVQETIDGIEETIDDVAGLRHRDIDIIDRLHSEVDRLRSGELKEAMQPLIFGCIRLHDQMVALGALEQPDSAVGQLNSQLLQTLEHAAGIRPFRPEPGDNFDSTRHCGVDLVENVDPELNGRVASTSKSGFERLDGSLVREAAVDVHRALNHPE